MIYISLPNDINFICGGLEKHLKSLKLDFKSPADALKDSDWLFHPICELFRKDNRLTVFFSPSLSRKRFRRWASVTIPTLCRTTRLLWWRMSCGWSWSCSVAVSPAHLSFFLQSNRLISSWLHPSTEKSQSVMSNPILMPHPVYWEDLIWWIFKGSIWRSFERSK